MGFVLTRMSSSQMSERRGLGWYSQTPNEAASKAGGLWFEGAPWPFEVLRRSVSSVPSSQTWRFSSVGLEPSSNSSMHCHLLGSTVAFDQGPNSYLGGPKKM